MVIMNVIFSTLKYLFSFCNTKTELVLLQESTLIKKKLLKNDGWKFPSVIGKENDSDEIRQLYNHYITNLDKNNLYKINVDMLKLIKSPLICCLLLGYFNQLNFYLIVDREIKLDSTIINEIDLVKILHALINNAVKHMEACEDDGTICLYINKKEKQYYIEIENFYKGNIDISKIYAPSSSEIQGRAGIGFLLANEILDDYKDVYHEMRIKQGEGIFIQALLLRGDERVKIKNP